MITADHGNSDQLWNGNDANAPHTGDTLNPVEVVIYGQGTQKPKLKPSGCLGDIAPTILELMELPKSEAMTGSSLILNWKPLAGLK